VSHPWKMKLTITKCYFNR